MTYSVPILPHVSLFIKHLYSGSAPLDARWDRRVIYFRRASRLYLPNKNTLRKVSFMQFGCKHIIS